VLTIGTRGSDLALWQAQYVQNKLAIAGISTEIKIIKTQGDQIQHLSFDKMEGKGFFTKEIEAALLDKSIDIAVHSHKDLETSQPAGLEIAAVPERAAPQDLLLVKKSSATKLKWSLKKNAVIGTSSARRGEQFKAHFPEVRIKTLRGNVPTRVDKLRSDDYDAIVLAKAGLDRLEIDLSDFVAHALPVDEFVPAAAQGALAIQMRSADNNQTVKEALEDKNTTKLVSIERSILKGINGGCQVPFGTHCSAFDGVYDLQIFCMKSGKANYASFSSDSKSDLIAAALKYILDDEGVLQ